MEKAKLKYILDDLDHYTKSYHVFAKKSSKFTGLVKWVEDVFPKLVLDKLVESFSAETQINVLGVGSGSGEMDSKMAASIKTRFKSVRNVVVEPGEKQLEKYRSLVESKKSEFEGIEFDHRQLSIDEYRALEGNHSSKYHFINAIQSLYYADDFNDTIRYLYDCLEEGGILLITIISDISGSWRLWNHFPRLQDIIGPYFCVQHLRQGLSSHDIPFHDIPFDENHQRAHVDITSCFEKGSKEGKLLVDFISQIVDFHGSASPEFYKEVVDYIGSEECSERKEDGTILYNNDWDAVVAQKPISK
eukprot:XP_792696.1 PREDICTED: histamine N-methyltransferase [Strongylocentrotus purpuratus]